jgi:hypothetical protein
MWKGNSEQLVIDWAGIYAARLMTSRIAYSFCTLTHLLMETGIHTCVDIAVVPTMLLRNAEKRLGSGPMTAW